MFSCSEYEARNYGKLRFRTLSCSKAYSRHSGRFLRGILSDLHKWFKDERAYISENRVKGKTTCLPGFQHAWSNKSVIEQSDVLSWHNFQQIVRKWHKKLFKVRLRSYLLGVLGSMFGSSHCLILFTVSRGLYSDRRVHACLQRSLCLEGNFACLPAGFGHGPYRF